MINAPRVDFVNFRVPIHVSLDKFFWTRNPTIIVSLINTTRNDVRLFAGSRRWITLENINYVRRQIVRGALHILLYNYGNEQRYLYRFENDATAVQIKSCWIVFFIFLSRTRDRFISVCKCAHAYITLLTTYGDYYGTLYEYGLTRARAHWAYEILLVAPIA